MTKEQECLSQLEKERQDYYKVLDWLKGNEGAVYLGTEARNIIRKAINADLTCIDSEIRALKKKGLKNESIYGI